MIVPGSGRGQRRAGPGRAGRPGSGGKQRCYSGGSSREHTESGQRCYLSWRTGQSPYPLAAQRPAGWHRTL